MSGPSPLDTGLTQRSIERELELLGGAIGLVAGGGAPAVVLAGLDFGPAILARCTGPARDQGVDLEPIWHSDDSGCDIRVHRSALIDG